MRGNITRWDAARAEILLAAVRDQGSLRAAARQLGIGINSAQRWWHRWSLNSDPRVSWIAGRIRVADGVRCPLSGVNCPHFGGLRTPL